MECLIFRTDKLYIYRKEAIPSPELNINLHSKLFTLYPWKQLTMPISDIAYVTALRQLR